MLILVPSLVGRLGAAVEEAEGEPAGVAGGNQTMRPLPPTPAVPRHAAVAQAEANNLCPGATSQTTSGAL